jgi:hypothetical protein
MDNLSSVATGVVRAGQFLTGGALLEAGIWSAV